jgi:NADH:ubiquinone reductase (H+-translocating)
VAPESGGSGRRRVAIVGGGFGGLAAAQALRGADVDVTVVDRMNHHLFQPLLYQAAAGGLSAGEVCSAIRGRLRRQRNASVLMAEVTDIDVDRRRIVLDQGDPIGYDSLIVACGAETSYFGHDEWKEVSFGLKTLRDALTLRDRIFTAFEEAERATDPEARDAWLTFVVVGGGPTGVEIAGQLAILAHSTMERDFSRIDAGKTRVILVDAGERVVPAFSEKLSAKAAAGLASLGVTVRERAMATSIDAEGLTLKTPEGEERIVSRTVIWAAGVRPAGLTEVLARATGASTDRGGRIEVNPDSSVPGHPEISAIGDMAKMAGPDGHPLPGLATVAIQQARHVAKGIQDGAPGAPTPFRYLDKGALAVVGRGKAVCEVRGLKLSGRPAFFMYLGVHLYYLSGVRGRRLRVLDAWTASRFGTRESWVIEGELPPTDPSAGDAQAGAREPASR